MELDSKDLMIDRLNSQIKQRSLNTSITDDDALTVPGNFILSNWSLLAEIACQPIGIGCVCS